jgi:hypothetical protein
MKMADGGYRPAYNIEYGTACHATSVTLNSLVESQLPTASRIPAGASLRFWG